MGLPAEISVSALHTLLAGQSEHALIDVREEGAFSEAHLFFACCLPLSQLELLLESRLPRRDVPIVLIAGCAADDWMIERAAKVLAGAGYTDLSFLSGGTEAWGEAGYEIFSGVNVPSKAFGEFVEHWSDTPRLPAEQVHAMQQAGEKMVILDSRPYDEYHRMSIPGGIDCPGAELVYRVHDQVPDDDTTIIVNCAGRTRSIIGAQSLINAGIPNPVHALKDGTMGWKLAGLELAHGKTERAELPGKQALAKAKACAAQVAGKYGVSTIDAAQFEQWRADPTRTTLLLDVRTEEEFMAGHWPGAMHAPGGQLVQATDQWVVVRNARLVLADVSDGVRAVMTAHWLVQLGWPQVCILTELPEQPQVGCDLHPRALFEPAPNFINAQALSDLEPSADCAILDFGSSADYSKGHIPGAQWALRSRLGQCAELLPDVKHWILISPDSLVAQLAAADLVQIRPDDQIQVLEGGSALWADTGRPMETEHGSWLTATDDAWPKPYDRPGGVEQAMQNYLEWELGLVAQVEREGLARYRQF